MRLLPRVDRCDDDTTDRQRDETTALVGDHRIRQTFLPTQRFDQRIPDERGITEAGDQRQRANARTRPLQAPAQHRSEEHTSELQSLMRISYAVFCLKKQKNAQTQIKEQ